MKKNLVIGLGTVGGATLAGFRKLGFDNFYGWDIDENKRNKFPEEWILNPKETKEWIEYQKGDKTISVLNIPTQREHFEKKGYKPKPSITDKDIIWICVQEKDVESIIKEYKDYTKNFVIRSTIPPSLFNLPEKYPDLNILHNPEFLREEYALKDFSNSDRIILGGNCPELKIYIKNLYREAFPFAKIIADLSFKESALCKLFTNAYLATLIGFWNEAKKICDKYNTNTDRIASVVSLDPRISSYGTICGAKFGGTCLPKDLNYLTELTIDLPLLRAVKKYGIYSSDIRIF